MEFHLFAALMFFGFIATEGVVEYFLGQLFEYFNVEPRLNNLILTYASAAAGVLFAWHYALDIPHVWLGLEPSLVGIVTTGMVMGRGANAVHQVAQLIADWMGARF